jgi:hypothetical protein
MEAYLGTKELWHYINGSTPEPKPAIKDASTPAEKQELGDWHHKCAKASGEIWLAIEDNQKVHVKEVKGDSPKMWKSLEAIHVQKKPATQFNTYQSLLGIKKNENESLSDLIVQTRLSRTPKHFAPPHSLLRISIMSYSPCLSFMPFQLNTTALSHLFSFSTLSMLTNLNLPSKMNKSIVRPNLTIPLLLSLLSYLLSFAPSVAFLAILKRIATRGRRYLSKPTNVLKVEGMLSANGSGKATGCPGVRYRAQCQD